MKTRYGDIVPKSDLERSFAMLVIVIGFCVYSYLTATLATIIRASDHNVDRYREKVSMMTTFMQQNRVPLTLQSKLRFVRDLHISIHLCSQIFFVFMPGPENIFAPVTVMKPRHWTSMR